MPQPAPSRSRALTEGDPSSLLLALPADALDQVVAAVYDAGEAFYVATTCSALRASIARMRAEGKHTGRAERLTALGTIFDTPTRTLWAVLEAFNGTSLPALRRIFVAQAALQQRGRAQALDDVTLTQEGFRICAFSKATDEEFLVLVGRLARWRRSMSDLVACSASGRVDMLKTYLTMHTPHAAVFGAFAAEGDFVDRVQAWRAKVQNGPHPWLTSISDYPSVDKCMIEFRNVCLAPAAKHGHHEIWAACIEFLGQNFVLGGKSVMGWAAYLCDKAIWRSIASSGKLRAFVELLTASTTCREIWQKSSEPGSRHSRMQFVRFVELNAVRCIYDGCDGTDAAAWKWMIDLVRKRGDVVIHSALDLRVWCSEYARVALLGGPMWATPEFSPSSELPVVQCVALYDLFLAESYEGGFFAATLLDNFSRAVPLNTKEGVRHLTMETHGEAIFGFVILDYWARRAARPDPTVDVRCPDMNDELASVLERAALATLACHETAYHGAVMAAVAMRGYSVSRLREVLRRTQDLLLVPEAHDKNTALLVQRAVTIPMMASAALTGDASTWEWCLSPITAHGRELPQPAAFDVSIMRLFARNSAVRGERRIVEWCLQRVGADEDLLLHLLHCPRAVDLIMPHLRAMRPLPMWSQALEDIATRAMDASPEAMHTCLEAGLYNDLARRKGDDQLLLDVNFAVANMQRGGVRKGPPASVLKTAQSSEQWIASRYRWYKTGVDGFDAHSKVTASTADIWSFY